MRIVLDENLPRPLIRIFDPAHHVAKAHHHPGFWNRSRNRSSYSL